MLVCVLLVAALAGQPAFGEDESGSDTAGAPTIVVSPSSGSSTPATSGSAKKAKKKTKAHKKVKAKKQAKVKAKKSKKAKSKKAHKKTKAKNAVARQDEAVGDPPPEEPPPPPPAEEPVDPTPPPESDPAPVPIEEPAPPEEGAATTEPALATAEQPPAADEAPAVVASDPATTEPIPADVASPAEPETAAPGSLVKKLTDPIAADTPGTTDTTGPGETPPGTTPPDDGTSDPTGPRAPGATGGGTIPGVLAPPGTTPATPAANPIIAGPSLQPAASDIFVQRQGTGTSRPAGGGTSSVGTLRQPSSLGLSQVTDLVKDIPAWIKLALAGLVALVLLLGAYTVLAAARTRRLERQRAKLMEDIGLLQAALLPAVPGRLGALLTTVAYRPADGPAAGGDFYDAFALSDGRVGLLLGDISGHGRQALAKTTLVRFTVRAHLEAGMSPREALAISGRSLDGRLSDDFSTVIAAIHDPVKGTLTYASAGHPPPLVVGPQAHEPVTASSAPPIGAGFPTGQRQTVLPMPEGTTVCVYSDGLLEARIDGEVFGRERLRKWLEELGPQATAKALLDAVVQRADRVPDDLAAVVLHAAPGATAPAARIEQLKLDVLDVEGPELDGFLKACDVSRADRAIAGRRVAEQLAVSGGVVVEVRIGEHPMVSVASIGEHAAGGSRPASRVR